MKGLMKKTILTLLSGALLLVLSSTGWAHAFLDHAEPAVGSEVRQAPSVVKLWFTQNLEPAFSAVEVQDAQGKVVGKIDAHLDAQNKSLFLVSMPSLPAGSYTVIWHVVSVDTHKTQGRFKFTVKPQN